MFYGQSTINLRTRAGIYTTGHADRAVWMLGGIIVVMKSDYDYREKENEGKKKCYFLAVQF